MYVLDKNIGMTNVKKIKISYLTLSLTG